MRPMGTVLVVALLLAIVVGVAAARQLNWKLTAAAVVACVVIIIWGVVLMWNTGRDLAKPWTDAAQRK